MAPGLTSVTEPVNQTGDRYIIAWSSNKLMAVVNMTEDDKRQFVRILIDDPAKDLHSNPIRDLIVSAVSNKVSGFELWEVDSHLDEDTIRQEFEVIPEVIKSEIRETGNLIYA